MTLSYIDRAATLHNASSVHVAQMTVAVHVAAVTIFNEDAQTSLHAERLVWAKKTVADPNGMARAMALSVLADPNIQNVYPNATDNQVQVAVDGLVNLFLNI